MQTVTRNRIAAALLAGGIALAAIPLGQAFAETGTPATPPAPPAPPAAPEAPQPPAPPAPPLALHSEKIVIVNSEGGDEDDDGLSTRVVTRDGKTFVFKTRQPLTDAELERRIAEAEANIPPVPPIPGQPGARIQKRIIVHNAERDVDVAVRDCDGHSLADVDASGEDAGKQSHVKIRVCGTEGETRSDALEALRRTRADIAADPGMAAGVRAEVLGKLDAEIAKLASGG